MYYEHNFFGVWLIGAIIGIIPFWRICTRVGYSPWLSLLIAIPLINIIFIYFLAFSDWPSQKATVSGGAS
jgi:hypothetical protein